MNNQYQTPIQCMFARDTSYIFCNQQRITSNMFSSHLWFGVYMCLKNVVLSPLYDM